LFASPHYQQLLREKDTLIKKLQSMEDPEEQRGIKERLEAIEDQLSAYNHELHI